MLCLVIILSSCASQKHGYRPAKRKKKDCDCSKWSYNKPIDPKNNYDYLRLAVQQVQSHRYS